MVNFVNADGTPYVEPTKEQIIQECHTNYFKAGLGDIFVSYAGQYEGKTRPIEHIEQTINAANKAIASCKDNVERLQTTHGVKADPEITNIFKISGPVNLETECTALKTYQTCKASLKDANWQVQQIHDRNNLIAEVVIYLVIFAVIGFGLRWLHKEQKKAIAEQMKKDEAITKALNEFDLK